jgi:hypothetical protein
MNWSDEELTILLDNYGKRKLTEWNYLLSRTDPAIRGKARELGLKADRSKTNKTTDFNENFFSIPNAVNCYIAGLIAADGCISSKRKSVWFYQKEKRLVEYIRDRLDSQNTIYFRKRNNTQEYSILFTSEKMVYDLRSNFGIIDNKSKSGLPRPDIDQKLAPYYVAGLIDGDGSITLVKDLLSFTLLCSKEIMDWINTSMNTTMKYYKRNDCTVDLYRMTGYGGVAKSFLFKILIEMQSENLIITDKWRKVESAKGNNAMSG